MRTLTKSWLVLVALTATACGDDGGEKAPPTNNNKPDAGFTEPEPDAEVEDPDAGVETDAEVGSSCVASKAEADKNGWAEGCYKCAPENNDQLLNSCAKGFRTFDEAKYPASWSPTQLPALP